MRACPSSEILASIARPTFHNRHGRAKVPATHAHKSSRRSWMTEAVVGRDRGGTAGEPRRSDPEPLRAKASKSEQGRAAPSAWEPK